MDGWNTRFLLGRPIFRGYVSSREGKIQESRNKNWNPVYKSTSLQIRQSHRDAVSKVFAITLCCRPGLDCHRYDSAILKRKARCDVCNIFFDIDLCRNAYIICREGHIISV